jgi:hypothetical protein
MSEPVVEPVKEEEFDVEAAKKTIKSVLGDDVDENIISKAIDHFRELSGAENGDDVLHFLQYAGKQTYDLIGIKDDDRIQRIATKINRYEATRRGGSRKRHTRKYASKHRKSARRGTKQRKSSRRQLRIRRRRTNKK